MHEACALCERSTCEKSLSLGVSPHVFGISQLAD